MSTNNVRNTSWLLAFEIAVPPLSHPTSGRGQRERPRDVLYPTYNSSHLTPRRRASKASQTEGGGRRRTAAPLQPPRSAASALCLRWAFYLTFVLLSWGSITLPLRGAGATAGLPVGRRADILGGCKVLKTLLLSHTSPFSPIPPPQHWMNLL